MWIFSPTPGRREYESLDVDSIRNKSIGCLSRNLQIFSRGFQRVALGLTIMTTSYLRVLEYSE